MFFNEIEMFKKMIVSLGKKLDSIEETQNTMLDLILEIQLNQQQTHEKLSECELVTKDTSKKFQACSGAFKQIKIVCEAFVERLDEAMGTITETGHDGFH